MPPWRCLARPATRRSSSRSRTVVFSWSRRQRAFDAAPFAASLEGALDPPYRAVARCRPEIWTVGAASIEVVRLDPDPRGDDLELTFDGEVSALLVDAMPASPAGAESLRSLAESRQEGAYAAHAHRLVDDLWEILILSL